MQRAVIFFAALALFVLCSLQATGNATFRELKPGEYALTGRIADTVHLPPACGYFAFAVAVKMDIINYSDTACKKEHIAVIFTCPDFIDDEHFFDVGQVHSVVLQNKNPAPFGWTTYDEERLRENGLHYDLYVDRILY